MRERPCAVVAGSCGQPLALIKGTCSSDPRSCPSSATMWLSSAAECRTPCRKHFLQCGNRPGHSPHIINQAPYASTIHCRLGDDEGVVGKTKLPGSRSARHAELEHAVRKPRHAPASPATSDR